jgi:hypothetical protein
MMGGTKGVTLSVLGARRRVVHIAAMRHDCDVLWERPVLSQLLRGSPFTLSTSLLKPCMLATTALLRPGPLVVALLRLLLPLQARGAPLPLQLLLLLLLGWRSRPRSTPADLEG